MQFSCTQFDMQAHFFVQIARELIPFEEMEKTATVGLKLHSYLNATIGSTFAPRRAGIIAAATDTAANSPAAAR